MRRFVLPFFCLFLLAGLGIAACDGGDSAATSETGAPEPAASGDAASSEVAADAARPPTAPPPDAGPSSVDAGSVPDDAVYPKCYSTKLSRRFFPCAASQTCVADCAACAGTTVNCVGGSLPGSATCGVASFELADRSCVASCEACQGRGLPLTDVCANTCGRLQEDFCNCGQCGRACAPTNPATPTACSGGHCCPNLPSGGITQWSAECGSCCVGGCPPNAKDRAQFCIAPVF